jgi:hypothetical protein
LSIKLKPGWYDVRHLQLNRTTGFERVTEYEWNIRTLRNAGFNRLALIHPEIWVPDPSAPDYDIKLKPGWYDVRHLQLNRTTGFERVTE